MKNSLLLVGALLPGFAAADEITLEEVNKIKCTRLEELYEDYSQRLSFLTIMISASEHNHELRRSASLTPEMGAIQAALEYVMNDAKRRKCFWS